jgi:hypothetical protein
MRFSQSDTAALVFQVFLLVAMFHAGTPLQAMQFKLVHEQGFDNGKDRFPDYLAIQASGEIVAGDSAEFGVVASKAGRDQYGNVRVFLDSPGGAVDEALAIVAQFDSLEVTAIVRSGAHCLSACASVLFASARIHLMEPGDGVLGYHSCFIAGKFPNAPCNADIANNAFFHGTAFGDLIRWMQFDAKFPDDVRFMGWQNAQYFGLLGPPTYDPTLGKPSFDCAKAHLESDRVICRNPRLARYERSFFKSVLAYGDYLTADARSKLPSTFQKISSAIKKRCGVGSPCLLKAFAQERRNIRFAIAKKEFERATATITDEGQLARLNGYLNSCVDSNSCSYPKQLDASYEFFMQNMAVRYAREAASGKNTGIDKPAPYEAGSADCLFERLCDPALQLSKSVAEYGAMADKLIELTRKK